VKRSEIGGREDFEELYFGGNESFIGKILGLGGMKLWRECKFHFGGTKVWGKVLGKLFVSILR